jgi:hypothetical protein
VEALDGGKAAVAVITEEFTQLASVVSNRAGWPGMRSVVLPYPLVDRAEEEIREIAREYFRPLLRACGVPD